MPEQQPSASAGYVFAYNNQNELEYASASVEYAYKLKPSQQDTTTNRRSRAVTREEMEESRLFFSLSLAREDLCHGPEHFVMVDLHYFCTITYCIYLAIIY